MDTLEDNGFSFCPKCGSGRGYLSFPLKSLECGSCGFVFYQNTAVGVSAVVARPQTKEILVAVRAFDPKKGSYDFPGGFVDPGEGLEEALKREIREELGVDLASWSYLCSMPNQYDYLSVTYNVCDVFFEVELFPDAVLQAADDVDSVFWLDPLRIDRGKFGFPSTLRGFEFWCKKNSLPLS